MEKKLELKHLSPYLPYGVNFLTVFDKQTPKLLTGICGNIIYYEDHEKWIAIDAIKPILRPLSDLVNEITHNGQRFVPLFELAKIHDKYISASYEIKVHDWTKLSIDTETTQYGIKHLVDTSNLGVLEYEFSYWEKLQRFSHRDNTRKITMGVARQLEMFKKLYEWHFDLDGLIPAGLAISYKEAGV